jgi:hypothetical protein
LFADELVKCFAFKRLTLEQFQDDTPKLTPVGAQHVLGFGIAIIQQLS